jgi:hypothetical protein
MTSERNSNSLNKTFNNGINQNNYNNNNNKNYSNNNINFSNSKPKNLTNNNSFSLNNNNNNNNILLTNKNILTKNNSYKNSPIQNKFFINKNSEIYLTNESEEFEEKIAKKLDSLQKKGIISTNNNNNNNLLSNNNNFQNNKKIFYSIKIDKNIPINVSKFGKYLISHIEKEENYRILFQNEIKKLKSKIKNIFSKNNSTDHYLTEYLLELWEKLEISFYVRYQILKQMIKLDYLNLYNFIDRETEYLTNYFQITENIFDEIKKRENFKLKLQVKLNRNELLNNDKEEFEEISKNLENNILKFKKKYDGIDIIWKGMKYDWFMNYENWFYDVENKK